MKTNPPYSQSGIAGDDIIMARKGSIRVAVASCSDPDTRAFIIQACNNHASLVSALNGATQCLQDAVDGGPYWRENAVGADLKKAYAALKKLNQ